MPTEDRPAGGKLAKRVTRVAEAALSEQQYVSPIDVLIGLGWLAPSHVDRWRQGRVDSLERLAQVGLPKIITAMEIFRAWARDRSLLPNETAYLASTLDHRQLRFSSSADPQFEQECRTHWISPSLSTAEQHRLAEPQQTPDDLVVIQPLNNWTCVRCSGTGDLLIMDGPGPSCLTCARLDHLVYLPAGNAALTRRARKYSDLSAVVVRFSRARHRYERQGLLVEGAALDRAEREQKPASVVRHGVVDSARAPRAPAVHPALPPLCPHRCTSGCRRPWLSTTAVDPCPHGRASTPPRSAGRRR